MATFPLLTLRLLPGEEHTEQVTSVVDPIALGGQTYTAAPAEVDASLAVQRATSGYVLALRFATAVTGPCMRCLEDAVVELAVDAREYHDLDPGGDDELVSDYVADDAVQVGAWMRDAIVLGLPSPILCRPDCAGLCPVCGRNLNTDPHTHPAEETDPRWAALEQLREQ
jgi:uncharacterized protein